MVASIQSLTYLDLAQTPEDDGKRYELLGGEIIVTASSAKKHVRVSYRLARMLSDHVEQNDLGEILPAPIDVKITPFDVVVPDIIFLSKSRVNIFGEQYVDGPPDLVVEVLSPSTRVRDGTTKLNLYARTGVAEYWIVDPDRASVTVHVLQANGVYQALATTSGTSMSSILPDLQVDPNLLFRDIS